MTSATPITPASFGGAPARDPVDIAASAVADALDADVLFYNGYIEFHLAQELMRLCRKRRRRKNVVLVMVTLGGDPDSGYRIARCLQSKYEKFYLFATGLCKSAGTLVALGAHELIFADTGELGPLDVQMSKLDSLFDSQSGLTVNAALTALQAKAYLTFEQFFLTIETRSQGQISVATAGEMATQVTVGLFAPLYQQVDPFHVGEAARAMAIADHYGTRLVDISQNIEASSLKHLVAHYPSHEYVIDGNEASELFENVRAANGIELALADALGDAAIVQQHEHQFVRYLSNELPIHAVTLPQTQVVQDIADAAPAAFDADGGTRPRPRKPADRPAPQPGA